MMQEIKQNLFTIHGILTSAIHLLIIVGGLSSWIFFRVQVMGQDVSMSFPTEQGMTQKLHK